MSDQQKQAIPGENNGIYDYVADLEAKLQAAEAECAALVAQRDALPQTEMALRAEVARLEKKVERMGKKMAEDRRVYQERLDSYPDLLFLRTRISELEAETARLVNENSLMAVHCGIAEIEEIENHQRLLDRVAELEQLNNELWSANVDCVQAAKDRDEYRCGMEAAEAELAAVNKQREEVEIPAWLELQAKLQAAEAEVERLEALRTTYENLLAPLKSRAEAAERDAKRMTEALDKYGRHLANCASSFGFSKGYSRPCDFGFGDFFGDTDDN